MIVLFNATVNFESHYIHSFLLINLLLKLYDNWSISQIAMMNLTRACDFALEAHYLQPKNDVMTSRAKELLI